eukprot:scaffold185043_cov15-Tisochrysis_lutea.AAC.1
MPFLRPTQGAAEGTRWQQGQHGTEMMKREDSNTTKIQRRMTHPRSSSRDPGGSRACRHQGGGVP